MLPIKPNTTIPLSNGVQLPIYGLGLSHDGGFHPEAVSCSLSQGVRLFDTASRYNTETPLAKALSKSKIPRNEYFVTTKLWPGESHNVNQAIDNS